MTFVGTVLPLLAATAATTAGVLIAFEAAKSHCRARDRPQREPPRNSGSPPKDG
jgi:hypothetical protein